MLPKSRFVLIPLALSSEGTKKPSCRGFGIEDWEVSPHRTVLPRVRSRFGVLERFQAKNVTRKRSEVHPGWWLYPFSFSEKRFQRNIPREGECLRVAREGGA